MSGPAHAHSNARPAGIGYALVSAALFGLSTPCSRWLLARIDPAMLAGVLYLGAGAGVAIVRATVQRGTRHSTDRLTRSDLAWLAGAVVSGGVAAPLALLYGLRTTPA